MFASVCTNIQMYSHTRKKLTAPR